MGSTWKGSGGGGITWTLTQHPSNLACVTAACAVTISALTAGNGALVASVDYTGTGAAQTISSATLTGETLTHCPSQYADFISGGGIHANVDCYYVASAAGGGSTTVTVTWSQGVNVDVQVLEFHRSTGTATLETCGGGGASACASTNGGASCSTCTGPTPTVTATDFVAAWNANENDCTSVASPFNTAPSPNVDNANVFGFFAWSLSQSSGNAAVYNCTSGTIGMAAIAFK